MKNFQELPLKELFNFAKNSIYNVYKNALNEEYKDVVDEELKKKCKYMASERTKMYVTTNFLSLTYYAFDINELFENKDRKSLIKIIQGCESLTYSKVRESWKNGLKEIFYKQKEAKEYSLKLSSTAIIVRDLKNNAFVKMVDGKIDLVENISNASEFVAISLEDNALKNIDEQLKTLYPNSQFKVFFKPKMLGRITSSF